jgi:hypothetical protein
LKLRVCATKTLSPFLPCCLLAFSTRKKFLGEIRSERILINTLNFVHIFEMDAHLIHLRQIFYTPNCLFGKVYLLSTQECQLHNNRSPVVVDHVCTLLPNQEFGGWNGVNCHYL